ncbi:MAG: peptidoglycan-binding protein [Propionibacteriaceae bacterium]
MKTSPLARLRPILLTVAAAIAFAGFLPAAPAHAAAATYRIAILGDSWAAGEGLSPYVANEGGGDTGCHRSLIAWYNNVVLPNGKSVRQTYDSGDASVQFLACTGAVTSDITSTTRLNEGPQLDRMFSTTTHVFLSISGNDLGFAQILDFCYTEPVASCANWTNLIRAHDFPIMKDRLTATIKAIHKKSPTAEIILTGYANPVGPGATPWANSWTLIRDLASDYNALEKSVVSTLDDTINIKFADIKASFAGHEDGSVNPYFFRAIDPFWPWRRLHPNLLGADAISRVVTTKVLKPFSCPTLVKSGATGECVKQIQRSLNAWNNYTTQLSFPALTIDGDFGAKTLAAVKAFQKYRGLTADGIVGSATKADLFDK